MSEDYFGIVGTTQAGAYRVERVVAEGGFAVVYRAYHDAFQAPVALKCLKIPQQMTSQNKVEFLKNFQKEAALLFRLSASLRAVVRPLHVDELATSDGVFAPFMAMEWLEGEALDTLVDRRATYGKPPLGFKRSVRLLAPVARAVARAHHFPAEDGPVAIVHRDIKPENIFIADLNGEKVVKILDFGIAKAKSVASHEAGRLSQSGVVSAFTPGYGAPEQWLPKRFGQTGPWTDVWGIALTVMECALGHPIIEGDTAAMMGTTCDEKRRPTPRAEGAQVSDAVEAVFAKALACDPRDRFADAGSFWDAMEAAVGLPRSTTPQVGGDGASSSDYTVPPAGTSRSSIPPSLVSGGIGSPRVPKVDEDVDAILDGTTNPAGIPAAAPSEGTLSAMVPDLELGPPPSRGAAPKAPPSSRKRAPQSKRRPAPQKKKQPPPKSQSSGGDLGGADGLRELEDDSDGPELSLDLADDAPNRGRSSATETPMPLNKTPASAPQSPMSQGSGGPRSPQTGAARISQTSASALSRSRAGVPEIRTHTPPSAFARIRAPLLVGVAGILLTVVDRVYAMTQGEVLTIGGMRLISWIAGVLTLSGIIWVMQRLLFSND